MLNGLPTRTTTMQRLVRQTRFPLRCSPFGHLAKRRISLERTPHATLSEPSQRIQYVTLLLAGTAFLSATSGYFFAIYAPWRLGETKETRGGSTLDDHRVEYGTAKDFWEGIEELKATFSGPGAVSDDPEVLIPYGYSENDYHPSPYSPTGRR